MNKSTKALLSVSAIALASVAWAAPTNTIALDYTATKIIGPTGATNACDPLQDSVRIGVSNNVVANIACSTSNVGIATANIKGRGMVYTVHSAGSIVAESQEGGGPGGKWSDQEDAVGKVASNATAKVNIADSSVSN